MLFPTADFLLPTKEQTLSKTKLHVLLFSVLCCRNPMELVMYMGNDFVASASVDREFISKPGYISSLKRELLKENEESLRYADNEPEFLVVNFSFFPATDPSGA